MESFFAMLRRFAPLALLLVLPACGGHKSSATVVSTTPQTTPSTTGAAAAAAPPGALKAEANSAAAGDIPDNQVFIAFADATAGYTIKYPEGWAQQGGAGNVTIRDKNNIVRIVVRASKKPTAATVRSEVSQLGGATVQGAPQALAIGGKSALKVVYTTQSAPNALTGKRVTLTVDRYYVWKGGKEAIVDLGTPVGVDNVDAYRLMIESFKWK